MFPKVVLTLLAIGALSVNALTVPVARSPAPEPESQELEIRGIPIISNIVHFFKGKREDLDELFSREPEDWAE